MADFWMILIIAIGLAMDCFTVSLCIGSSPAPKNPRSIFRVSFHFGLFQGGMALLGWLLGSTVVNLIARFDHWIAMALLGWVGGRMIMEGLSHKQDSPVLNCDDPSRGGTLVMLAVATSIDALGVGLSLALLQVDVLSVSLIIALVSLILSVVGLLGGDRLSQRFGKGVEVVGGMVLIFIGLRIVVTHLRG
jgi:manganese efflux pump family protein